MSALTVTLLGQFQARLDNQPITDFKTRKVQALLIYVTAEPEKHLRESLMDLMWPGMPTDQPDKIYDRCFIIFAALSLILTPSIIKMVI